jgi:CheY-specific phosphatase CheX
MISSLPSRHGAVSAAITDAVKAAVETTFAQILGEKPVCKAAAPAVEGPSVAGILSFVGDVCWTLTLVMTKDIAPSLARKFTGMDFSFDSSDMGDVAAELVNVLAGDVIAQLERRRIKSKMSLPTVARGDPLVFVPEKGLTVARLDFASRYGNFWFRVATPAEKI